MTRKPSFIGAIVSILVGSIAMVLVAELGLRVTLPHWREFDSGRFIDEVPIPGHGRLLMGTPNFDGWFAQNNNDFRVHIQINEFGLRNTGPVSDAQNALWAIGDSQTFGWGVEREETFVAVAGATLGIKSYNIATPGGDLCHYEAVLSRMPKDVRPKAVVVGITLENDVTPYDCAANDRLFTSPAPAEPASDVTFLGIKQMLIRYSALYNLAAVSFKRIAVVRDFLVGIGLLADANKLEFGLAGNDISGAVRDTVRQISIIRQMLPEHTPFVVLVSPARHDLKDGDPIYRRLRESFVGALAEAGIPVVDPFAKLKEAGYEHVHFAHDGHWNALGNRIAGVEVAYRLKMLLQ